MFCPKCSSLMIPKQGKLVCMNCGTEREIEEKDNTKIMAKSQGMDILVIEDSADTLPRTKAECPKCGHNEAYWVIRQTRAADEPETRIYRCTKCGHTWREY